MDYEAKWNVRNNKNIVQLIRNKNKIRTKRRKQMEHVTGII